MRKIEKSDLRAFLGWKCLSAVLLENCCLHRVSELYYSREQMCPNRTERSDQRLGSDIVLENGHCIVLLDLFFLVGVGTYKESFSSESTVVVELNAIQRGIERWAASLAKREKKEEVLNVVSDNCVL